MATPWTLHPDDPFKPPNESLGRYMGYSVCFDNAGEYVFYTSRPQNSLYDRARYFKKLSNGSWSDLGASQLTTGGTAVNGKSAFTSFGYDISCYDDYLMIAAYEGVAVYKKNISGEFAIHDQLTFPTNSAASGHFHRIKVEGNYAFVSNTRLNSASPYGINAKLYIFKLTGTTWSHQQTITGSNGYFGSNISAYGEYLAISNVQGRTIEIYKRNVSGTYVSHQSISQPARENNQPFGDWAATVAISDKYLVVGKGPKNTTNNRNWAIGHYYFNTNTGNYEHVKNLIYFHISATNQQRNGGSMIKISGNTVVIGSHPGAHEGQLFAGHGSVAVFKASNTDIVKDSTTNDYSAGILVKPTSGIHTGNLGNSFGFSFDVNGSQIILGVPTAIPNVSDKHHGNMYLYKLSGPSYSSASVTETYPKSITLTFDQSISSNTSINSGDFTVQVAGSDATINNIIVDGGNVRIGLDTRIAKDEAVTVAYTKSSTASQNIIGSSGIEVDTLTAQSVTNNTTTERANIAAATTLAATSDLKPIVVSTINSFLALKSDGTLVAWGKSGVATSTLPSGITNSGFTDIAASYDAFAALNSNGTVISWGNSENGGTGAPTDTDFVKLYSNYYAFLAHKKNGKVKTWGKDGYGAITTTEFYRNIIPFKNGFVGLRYAGTNKDNLYTWGYGISANTQRHGTVRFVTKPSTTLGGNRTNNALEYVSKIALNEQAISAIYADAASSSEQYTKNGSIAIGGTEEYGGKDNTLDLNTSNSKRLYKNIYTTQKAFAAINTDGSILAWGDNSFGGSGAPTGTGFTKIYSTDSAFAALKSDGSISVWGDSSNGGASPPGGTGFTKIFSTSNAFAAMKADGSISVWGDSNNGGSGSPIGTGFTKIFSNDTTFVALHTDGYIKVWGGGANNEYGATGEPVTSDIFTVIPSKYAFTAIKTDGSVCTWGDDSSNTYLAAADAPSDLQFSTSNFNYKKSVCELHRWSAIDEINNIDHELNKETYYFSSKVNLISSSSNINDKNLISGKLCLGTTLNNGVTYTFKTSINHGDFKNVNLSRLMQVPVESQKKRYYFDISGVGVEGHVQVHMFATIDNVKYRSNGTFTFITYDTSDLYDISNKTISIYNMQPGQFDIGNVDSNVDKAITGLVSVNNRDWMWFKNTSNNAIPTNSRFILGTSHPTSSVFSMTLGRRYYIKIGFSKTLGATNNYTFTDTIEYYYVPSGHLDFSSSLTSGNTFITLNLTHNSSYQSYIKEMQIKYYESLTKYNSDTPDETFTIPKSKTSYTFHELTNDNRYGVRISPIDLNNNVNAKVESKLATPTVSWLSEVDMKTNATYDIPDDEGYHQTVYADNNYIQYFNRTSSPKAIKILKKSGSSWNQVTNPFPSDNLPSFANVTSSINHFHKSRDYYAYYEKPASNTTKGYICVYKQGSDGKMTYINKVQLDIKHNEFHSFTMNEDSDGVVTIYYIKKKGGTGSNSNDLDTTSKNKNRVVYPSTDSQYNSGWRNYVWLPGDEKTNANKKYNSAIYFDYNRNYLHIYNGLLYIKKDGGTAVTIGSSVSTTKYMVFTTNNFILLISGESTKQWGWINFNRDPKNTSQGGDGEWSSTNTTGAYKFVVGTSNAAGFINNSSPLATNFTSNIYGNRAFIFGTKHLILTKTNGNKFGTLINLTDNSSETPPPSTVGFFRYYEYSSFVRTVANDFTIFSETGKALSTDSPPASANDDAISLGISTTDVNVLKAVTFSTDDNDSTKSIPETTVVDKIKSIMDAIASSNITDNEKKVRKRKQRRASLKVLFNKSRQVKKMVIPKEKLDLPTTFTKTKAVVLKAGETMKLTDLAEDEGAYTVLDDGEEITYETTNTILTFTRDDVGDAEIYQVDANPDTWKDTDGEDIVINTDDITGTFSSDNKDGTLLPGDNFTIDGQSFFIGSIGTGGSGGSGGDPYIYPLKSNIPVKLPNKKAFYRMFEQGNNYINIEVDKADENHKNRMLEYAQNITPVTHNIVMDGYFYCKLFISAEGHKLTIDYKTKKASCDEKDIKFFKFSENIKRFNCGEFYEDCKSINIKWRTKQNKLIKTEVLFFPNPHIENGINVVPETLKNTTGMLIENYKPKLMQVPSLTTEKYNKLHKRLAKSKKTHHIMSIKGKNEKWVLSK